MSVVVVVGRLACRPTNNEQAMTHSTEVHANVTGPLTMAGVDCIADDLVELQVQTRRTWLRKREPRSSYVRDAFKRVRNKIAKPFHLLLSMSFADVDDGAPANLVVQPYEACIALIRERAAHRTKPSGLPFAVRLNAIMAKETRAEGKVTALQLALAADPSNVEIRVDLRSASREYRSMLDELDALLDEGYAQDQLAKASA